MINYQITGSSHQLRKQKTNKANPGRPVLQQVPLQPGFRSLERSQRDTGGHFNSKACRKCRTKGLKSSVTPSRSLLGYLGSWEECHFHTFRNNRKQGQVSSPQLSFWVSRKFNSLPGASRAEETWQMSVRERCLFTGLEEKLQTVERTQRKNGCGFTPNWVLFHLRILGSVVVGIKMAPIGS